MVRLDIWDYPTDTTVADCYSRRRVGDVRASRMQVRRGEDSPWPLKMLS